MRIQLDKTGHITGYAYIGGFGDDDVNVDHLPDGDPLQYRYENGLFIYDPVSEQDPEPEQDTSPSVAEQIQELRAQNEMLIECLLEMSELVYS